MALLTFVCFRLQAGLAIASLLYLTVVVLLSVSDAFGASLFVSIIAVLCLDYFFTQPLFSLQMDDPLNIVAVIVFLGTALLISRVMSQRKRAEAALQKLLGELESKVQERTAELARANDELRGEMRERQRAEEALQKAQAELAHVQGRQSGERSDPADPCTREKDRAADGSAGYQRCHPRGYFPGAA